jgi:hypothetical protein
MPILYNNKTITKIYKGEQEYKTVFKGEDKVFPGIFEIISQSLYDFTTFTFTSAGQTGRTGPTLGQCQTAYASEQ